MHFYNGFKQVINLWFQSFIVVEISLNYKDLMRTDVVLPATISAFVPVVWRWLNPKDTFPTED